MLECPLLQWNIILELTDQQWQFIEPSFPHKDLFQTQGRPRHHARDVLEGILWILRTGARWKDLPDRFPPYQTCHRRYQEWVDNGVLEDVLRSLIQDLEFRGKIDLSETYIDGSFVSAKKGVLELVRQSVEKGPRSWQLRTATVFLSQFPLEVLLRMKSR